MDWYLYSIFLLSFKCSKPFHSHSPNYTQLYSISFPKSILKHLYLTFTHILTLLKDMSQATQGGHMDRKSQYGDPERSNTLHTVFLPSPQPEPGR